MTKKRSPLSSFGVAFALVLAGCATPQSESVVSTKASVPAPQPAYDPSEILGKSPDAVDLLLGAPALTRREGPGEFRRYALGECALLVIVYPNEKGEPRVAHLDTAATQSGAPKPTIEQCLGMG